MQILTGLSNPNSSFPTVGQGPLSNTVLLYARHKCPSQMAYHFIKWLWSRVHESDRDRRTDRQVGDIVYTAQAVLRTDRRTQPQTLPDDKGRL